MHVLDVIKHNYKDGKFFALSDDVFVKPKHTNPLKCSQELPFEPL
jgi:hypothetical protein